MKLNRSIIWIVLALIAGVAIGGTIFSGSSEESAVSHDHENETGVWTCSMHPQVRQSEAGSCPFCGMDLIPLSVSAGESQSVLKMSEEAIALANIQTTVVGLGSTEGSLSLNGKVKLDERKVHSQTTHFSGRIEELFRNFTGEEIRRGEAIASMYSPELVAAQEEFLEAKRVSASNPKLFEATKKKLKFWKISDAQIASIAAQDAPLQEINLLSEFDGVIVEKLVNDGDHLIEGQSLMKIANLNSLWIIFDVYEKDLNQIELGQDISFSRNGSTELLEAKVSFISQEVNPTTRTIEVRANFDNVGMRLKPDMFVKGQIEQASQKELTVPKTAVLWTGERSVVYVKIEGEQAFEMRVIELGQRMGDSYVVKSGLNAGEEVVMNGVFILDAEAQLQGKTSMMMPVGSASNLNEQGFIESSLPIVQDYQKTTDPLFQEQLLELTLAYLNLKDAMVEGQAPNILNSVPLVEATLQTVDMSLVKGDAHMHWMSLLEVMEASLKKIKNNPNRDTQRLEFINLSNALINAIRSFGTDTESSLYIQFCPMANNDQGANWISTEENIINPYFGDMMLTCGSVEEIINPNNL